MTPEDVVGRIEDWQDKDVRWEALGGGITNLNYVVTVRAEEGAPDGERFVLHIPGEGTDTFIDREHEQKNHAAAAATGVAPPLLHVVEPGSCTVVPFIDGETLHPETVAGHLERLEKIVDAMRTYHEGAVFVNEIRLFDMVRDYSAMARDVGAPRPAEFDFMYSRGRGRRGRHGTRSPRPHSLPQ